MDELGQACRIAGKVRFMWDVEPVVGLCAIAEIDLPLEGDGSVGLISGLLLARTPVGLWIVAVIGGVPVHESNDLKRCQIVKQVRIPWVGHCGKVDVALKVVGSALPLDAPEVHADEQIAAWRWVDQRPRP